MDIRKQLQAELNYYRERGADGSELNGFLDGFEKACDLFEASAGKNNIESSEPHLPLADVSGAVCGCERDYVCGLCYKQKGYKVVDGKLQTDH